jgi:hypothetical protein
MPQLMEASRHFMKLPEVMLSFPVVGGHENGVVTLAKNKEMTVEVIRLTDDACCFVGHTPALPGKFDIKRAQQFAGLRKECYGLLKSGQSVTLDGGQVVHPEDVLDTALPSRHFAVLCSVLPSQEALLQQLLTNNELNRCGNSVQNNRIRVHSFVSISCTYTGIEVTTSEVPAQGLASTACTVCYHYKQQC